MDKLVKEQVLKAGGWFQMQGSWHHPNLPKKLDLDTAFLYQQFKDQVDHEDEGILFDDDMGS